MLRGLPDGPAIADILRGTYEHTANSAMKALQAPMPMLHPVWDARHRCSDFRLGRRGGDCAAAAHWQLRLHGNSWATDMEVTLSIVPSASFKVCCEHSEHEHTSVGAQ